MTEFPSIERFRQWLERRPSQKVLAEAWNLESCPLCIFLKSEGADKPTVMPREWSVGGKLPKPLPEWAKTFVYWVDKVQPRTVTNEEALYILNGEFRSRRVN